MEISKEILSDLVNSGKLELNACQDKLCLTTITRFYNKMCIGIKFPPIKVADGIIMDGHHRYVASRLADVSISTVPSKKTSATVVTDWKSVSFEEINYYPKIEISRLNRLDARFNNMTIEQFLKLVEKP